MPTLELTDDEWRGLTMLLAKQPWEFANPIMYKMAMVMRSNMVPPAEAHLTEPWNAWGRPDGSGKPQEGRSGL